MKKRKWNLQRVCIFLMAAALMLPAYRASAAGVGILTATDGSNFLSQSPDEITALTAPGAEIVLEGLASPAGNEATIRVRSAAEPSNVVYANQLKSDRFGRFTFRFSTEEFAPDTYAVVVNAAGAQQPQTVYFRIAPPQVPQGAHDVFSCFTVNGRPVSFDESKYAFFEVPAQERDTIPVFDIATVDKTAAVTVTPSVMPKIPCAVRVDVAFADGTQKAYSLVLDEVSDKRITDLTVAGKAGQCEIEYDIRLGDSTENASLVYSDRNNVYWRSASSPIFAGAAQIKRSKSDASGFTNDHTTLPDEPNAPKISSRPYYAGAYSGQNGEPYWMSFKVHADATVFMADGHGQGWPNNDGTWKNDSLYTVAHGSGGASASGKNLYYKKVKAGETVQIPNYGVPENWPPDYPNSGYRVYDPPAFAVVWDSNGTVEGTDADLAALSYRLDGGEPVQITDFRPDLDHYTITVDRGVSQITFDASLSDDGAVLAEDAASPVSLKARETTKTIRVVSAGGIVTKTYTVTIKKNLDGICYGDVDGNGAADINDATMILRKSLALPTSDSMEWLAADVDGDGAITVNDATMVLRHSLRLPIPPNILIGKQ